LSELAELQEELVEELAAHLGVQIQKVEMERALKRPGDITAWEAIMRSWAAYARLSTENVAIAVARSTSGSASQRTATSPKPTDSPFRCTSPPPGTPRRKSRPRRRLEFWPSFGYHLAMSTFSVAEAKNNLSKLIDLALKGEKVTITRHGMPVVELRPARKTPQAVSVEALAQLRAARERIGAALGEDAGVFISRMRDEDWEGR
jgi:prevent-host-death family protein